MHNKVFISYAKEDYSFAERLYNFLEKNNFDPWLDKKKILPGQNWNFVIRKSLREANYIILLLSNISVEKRGYVQREFKAAYDFVEEKLEDDIYLIPLKINNCKVPENLSKFQWIEYDSDSCFNLILQSLLVQKEKYIEYERRKVAAKELFAYSEYEENLNYGVSKSFDIETKYFQFLDETNSYLKELNSIIKGKQNEYIIDCRKQFYKINGELIDLHEYSSGWVFQLTSSPNLITKSIISINENAYAYTGGAHGNGSVSGLNYNLSPLFIIKIEDIFNYKDHDKVLTFFSNYCYEELRRLHNEWLEPDEEEILTQTPESLFWENSLIPKWENFNNFFISKSGLEIIFNTYSVSSYAFGVQIILIPYERLLSILSEPDTLKNLVQKLQ